MNYSKAVICRFGRHICRITNNNSAHERNRFRFFGVFSGNCLAWDCSSRRWAASLAYAQRFRQNAGGRECPKSGWNCVGYGLAGAALLAAGSYDGSDVFDALPFCSRAHAAQKIDQILPETVDGKQSRSAHLNFIADVVEKVAPAVVFIDAVQKSPFLGEHALTSGSGFIVRADGYILTNAHVVEGVRGRKLRVHLHDRTVHEGYVTYVDTAGDLALVRINAKNLPVLPLGDSNRARPGEWVVALGSPFSLTNTVTMGIISSTHRAGADLGLQNSVNYIQTDALITFGNSGGPLVNLDGDAIGINSMKVTDGISFAIPSNYAKQFLAQCTELEEQSKNRSSSWLGKKNKTELARSTQGRRRIGVTLMQLDETTTQSIRTYDSSFPQLKQGLLVHSVIIDQPAHLGGVLPGDIITHVNGKEVVTSKDFMDIVESSDSVRLRLLRKSRQLELEVHPSNYDY